MASEACHPASPTAREKAKAAIQRLGVAKVAAWCNVGPATPYQWLSRGSDVEPIPPNYVPAIVAGARADGVEVDPTDLWPAAAHLLPADEVA